MDAAERGMSGISINPFAFVRSYPCARVKRGSREKSFLINLPT